MRNLSEAVDDLDLVNGVNRRGKAAVDAEDFVVDDHTKRQEVEHIGEVMPDAGVAVLP